ncbi:DeoR/GlpR family DNA-binding transcription regulator [Zafaria sp. J156]|uniref:DeoR/GlpR family DNA-binding transcription regulator n=1 Tax=Zafaria sp. J156 TaxID=3116490 RepID=UPI002E76C611|nr:DeoR/GlpR family DNA-binding transcription regulator [Zafaria sp. J156]MEE1621539.1 DeoR/GlpR family DNA-binding transcription regulator [Zafaria sp. J156]
MTEMLPPQRRRHILEQLNKHGQVRVTELSQKLGVSEMTVRRDLNQLAAEGSATKVHGGATREASATSAEPGFAKKLGLQSGPKELIATAASALVRPGMSLALNSGTTTFTLARHCTSINDLTIITNSPRIAAEFYAADNTSQTVILTGGVHTPSDALVGPLAVAALGQLHVDVVFMGVHGMTVESGITTPNMLEAQVNRALMASAARTIVLADHTKWGVTGLCRIADLAEVDLLITDRDLDASARDELREHVDELLVADAAS